MDERPFSHFAVNLLQRKFPVTNLMWVLCSSVVYVFRKTHWNLLTLHINFRIHAFAISNEIQLAKNIFVSTPIYYVPSKDTDNNDKAFNM